MFKSNTSGLTKIKNKIDCSMVLVGAVGSWGLAYFLTEYLDSYFNLLVAFIIGFGFVSLMLWFEIDKSKIIENDIPTIQPSSSEGKPFSKKAHTIKLGIYSLLSLSGGSLIFIEADDLANALQSAWSGIFVE